ncbi:MAG: tryptophan synthase subunit alpha [Candidatus Omnitrophota bacterium]
MAKNDIQLMTHLVAGFPDRQGFAQAVSGLKQGGADILELQIPFSDPTADGPVITRACEEALGEGFRVNDTFEYIRLAQDAGFKRIVLMTYANIVFRYGFQRYADDMKRAGIEAVLVPDLPFDDEDGFYQTAFDAGLDPMPVAVVSMSAERLEILQQKPFRKIYVSIRSGITGQKSTITPQVKDFLSRLSAYERFAGFGIRSAQQIQELAPYADAAVVGSYFTDIIACISEKGGSVKDAVRKAVQDLKAL